MKIKLLGSGGAFRIPRACCSCIICKEARKKGNPYERLGESLFIENQNILFDTPEDINTELNNQNIQKVKYLFFSHWHPDHTAGIRILETINANKKTKPIKVYMTNYLKKDFKNKVKSIFFFEKKGYCKIILKNKVKIDTIIIKFIKLNNDFAYAFLIKEGNKKVIFCPCHCIHLPVSKELKNIDLLIMNLGYFGKKKKNITGFEKDNLRLIKELKPKNTILTHIEEVWNKNYDDYCKLEKEYEHLNIKFAFDGMEINV